MKLPVLLSAALLSTASLATEYSFIGSLQSQIFDGEYTSSNLAANYYFNGLKAKGPLDYFGYNPRANQIGFNSSLAKNDDMINGVNGEFNYDGFQFKLNYSVMDTDHQDVDSTKFVIGYYFNDQWSLGYERARTESTYTFLNANYDLDNINQHNRWQKVSFSNTNSAVYVQYQHQFADNQTVEVRLKEYAGKAIADIEFFTPLVSNQYLKLTTLVLFEDYVFNAQANYYLSERNAVGFGLMESDVRSISYQHFYNSNIKLKAEMYDPFESASYINLSVMAYF